MKKYISFTGIIILLVSICGYYFLITKDNSKSLGETKEQNAQVQTEKDIRYTSASGLYLTEKGLGGSTTNVTKNITLYDSLFKKYSQLYGQKCTLLKAIMYAESGGDTDAKSRIGGVGLMGLLPETAKKLNVKSIKDLDVPKVSIEAGASYLSRLEKTACNGGINNLVCTSNDVKYIVAAFGAGTISNKASEICPRETVWQCIENSQYSQIRSYVERVIANLNKLEKNNWGC